MRPPAGKRKWIVRYMERAPNGRPRLRVRRYVASNRLSAKFQCVRVPGRLILSARRVAGC